MMLDVERPRAADLEQPDAELVGARLVDAEVVERLAHVEIALADGDDADLGVLAARIDDAVEAVGADEGGRGARACTRAAAASWPSKSISWRMLSPPGGMSNSGMTMFSRSSETSTDAVEFDVVLDAFDRRPGAGEARQRIAVEAVVDQLLHAGRVEDRDHRVDEQEFRRVRDGRGFGRMVVAHQRQHAAMLRRAGEVGVAEDVAGAVDAGALAVPDARRRRHACLRRAARSAASPSRRSRQAPR